MDEDFDIPAVDQMDDDFDFAGAGNAPILKVGEEKEIGALGLKKKLLKEGEGWDTPEVGDEVHGTSRYLCSSLFVLNSIMFFVFSDF